MVLSGDCYDIEPTKKKDCTSYELTDTEKARGLDSCCYMTYKENGKDTKSCGLFVKKAVNKDYIKASTAYQDLSIECNSNWLSLTLSFLLFGLLL
jgi:hypothetical protein